MWWMLFKKEVSEVVPIGITASVALLFGILGYMPLGILKMVPYSSYFGNHFWEIDSVPFLDEKIHPAVAVVFGVLSAVLAFYQILFENQRKTFPVLFRLPIPRTGVILTKLLAGVAAYLLALGLPILVYAAWAATPGTHPSPFYWSMVWIPMGLIPAGLLLYFAWVLILLLPGRWYGSRILPLATAGMVAFLSVEILRWSMLGLLMIALTAAAYIACICWAAEMREY
jgi:ABC-type transport system involved in multi-copper enzyme maturation permease subunit